MFKVGQEVVTRDGRKGRIKSVSACGNYPIIAWIDGRPTSFTQDGRYWIGDKTEHDIFPLPEAAEDEEGYGFVYPPKEDAFIPAWKERPEAWKGPNPAIEALNLMCPWEETAEGYDFWDDIRDRLIRIRDEGR